MLFVESGWWIFIGIHYKNHLSFSLSLFFFPFLGLHPQHMEVPTLGVKLELELPAFASATATWDPSQAVSAT